MSSYKTASIVFLLLTMIIALVLSGLSNPVVQKKTSCQAKAVGKAPVAAVGKAPVATKPVVAPPSVAPPVTPVSRSTGTFSPYSGVPQSVTYQSAYASGESFAASSDRTFEYLLTPIH